MAKNPYFLDNTSEQRLIEDLTRETISAMGRDVYYIPRKIFNKDYLFGEDPVSKFQGSYKIEMYVQSVGGFEGQGDIISKFGIELKDRVELVVSRKRFEDLISRSDSDLSRPREGDLIYFPLSDTLFEILGNGPAGPTAVQVSNATGLGTVYGWNANDSNKLIIGNRSGSFTADSGEYVYGVASGATGQISTSGSTNLIVPLKAGTTSDLLDSLNLEKEKNDESIFDFTDTDPFSEGRY